MVAWRGADCIGSKHGVGGRPGVVALVALARKRQEAEGGGRNHTSSSSLCSFILRFSPFPYDLTRPLQA